MDFADLPDFAELAKLMELMEKDFSAPRLTPIHKPSMTSMVWNISVGRLGPAACCAPSQLLHTCSLAGHGKLEKVLDFLATAKNISVLSTLFSY